MYTRILRPDTLAPEELDRYLERGWYRIGQTVMTCRFLLWGGVLRSAIWTRTPLSDYRFRKGLRKLMNRNGRRFRLSEGPMVLDGEREALYRRYLTVARGDRAESLAELLYGDSDRDLFETREIGIWEGDRLVGFSWFDLGRESIQSLIGVYDPACADASLGFYSLLLEVRYGMETGRRFHYSGYVLPGEPAMDYKLRVGHMQWLDVRLGTWRPWECFREEDLPTRQLREALWSARAALLRAGVSAAVRGYPMFEAGAYDEDLSACLDQPLVVECSPRRGAPVALVVTWDLDCRRYNLLRCVRMVGRYRSAHSENFGAQVELLVVARTLATRETAEGIAAEVSRLSGSADR